MPRPQAQEKIYVVGHRTEVESLLGDPTKSTPKLVWVPEITVQQMCAEMVAKDLKEARKQSLLQKHWFQATLSGK